MLIRLRFGIHSVWAVLIRKLRRMKKSIKKGERRALRQKPDQEKKWNDIWASSKMKYHTNFRKSNRSCLLPHFPLSKYRKKQFTRGEVCSHFLRIGRRNPEQVCDGALLLHECVDDAGGPGSALGACVPNGNKLCGRNRSRNYAPPLPMSLAPPEAVAPHPVCLPEL